MPGCEDPMNKTDTKTKGRGNRGKEGKGSACHTVVLLANRAAQPAPPCATNHLHPQYVLGGEEVVEKNNERNSICLCTYGPR